MRAASGEWRQGYGQTTTVTGQPPPPPSKTRPAPHARGAARGSPGPQPRGGGSRLSGGAGVGGSRGRAAVASAPSDGGEMHTACRGRVKAFGAVQRLLLLPAVPLQKNTPGLGVAAPFFPPPAPAATAHFLSADLPVKNTPCEKSHTRCGLRVRRLSLDAVLKFSQVVAGRPAFPPLLGPNDPFSGWATICVPIRRLMDLWAIPTVWPL